MGLIKRVNQLAGNTIPTKERVLAEARERRGEQALPFIATGTNGETITLDDYAGQTLTLLFMSSICQPCIEKIPALNAHYHNSNTPRHQFLVVDTGVNGDEDALTDKHGLQIPVIQAPYLENSLATDYGANSTPYFVTITPQGTIHAAGALLSDYLQEQLSLR
ncbi:MAG: TlpA family protein disulfide reductase [Chloroflexi bacterium]|nr:TlpA family protein disulfide reductase [Chloroflexota bacterium]